jgi:hypothetical protein
MLNPNRDKPEKKDKSQITNNKWFDKLTTLSEVEG